MKFSADWLVRGESKKAMRYDSAAAYRSLLNRKLKQHGKNRDLAFAESIGSLSVELFRSQGDVQVLGLRHYGLADGMRIYDLGCGCGRTAQALQRSGWEGHYTGTDIVDEFITELVEKCPGYEAFVHRRPTILANDNTLDIIYHWSVFTHISPEESFLYLKDSFRALKPGGKTIFTFVELTNPSHFILFNRRVDQFVKGQQDLVQDIFLHRDWIRLWAEEIGFTEPTFTDGDDGTNHPPFWQTIAIMSKD